ncbi:MAG: tetratricopeptide repeat protein [Spirochaetales bacterium]|nr:tetratricopeptide repeat protein [Spirochaetales bacterium]
MPRAVNYKANSIVYFEGDKNENIYILQGGAVMLRSYDLENGQEIQDYIKTGEFFGVKSALGRFPKEETAQVVKDSTILVMSVPEFEALALKNSRIIIKMLKVFSNQLRRIHKQVRNLLSSNRQPVDSESGLYKIGEYYLKNRKYEKAKYVFDRYIEYYPDGMFSRKASEYSYEASECMKGKAPKSEIMQSKDVADYDSMEQDVSELTKKYFQGVSLFNQEKFEQALKVFREVNSEGVESEYGVKSISDIGKCYFALKKWDECIKQYTFMIQKFPKHPDLVEALLYVGNCYKEKGVVDKAAGFYKKILIMAKKDSQIYRKADKALKSLQERQNEA